ncbi:chromobox protein homolog 5 [Solenopsis invicta]|uniref:chromobox protein homolog 5 n=1 Tax=Solenopsis invicta TaxID=13686 RepID=UPI0005958B2E|nr:chromobox protein homolog 5 [Solenopsis invicta]XP_025993061.1 chromobox protein homolog 5 [Solenopsis invicta]
MRRLGMKNKQRKSEAASDNELEENGARAASDTGNETQAGKNNNSARRSATKRRSARGASLQKSVAHTDDAAEAANTEETAEERGENGEKASSPKSSPNKRRKKEDSGASTSARDKSEQDDEYEVEKLINLRTIKGRRQFLVRWKGYGDSADTWENEKDLNCPQLIEDYLLEEKEKEKEMKLPKTDKSKKSKVGSKKQPENDEQNNKDGKESSKEFEVEKIIEVRFKKNGAKEFLIRWKGFSANDDTWEPEKNLNCQELISKFMQKVEQAKTSEMRELRTNPAHTKRYTLASQASGRRLSKRNRDKQRTTYHECEN